ncbi:MAG: carboxypeptidase regulatory-like domain-containing protein [Planctomycetota bacterium]
MEGAELERRLVEEVLLLAEPYRSAVLLRFFAGRSVRQIAADRSLPIGTVETHLKRAIAELRERLDRGWGDRRSWGMALLSLVTGKSTSSLAAMKGAAALLSGGLLMTLKLKVAIVALVVITLLATWWVFESVSEKRAASSWASRARREVEQVSPRAQHTSDLAADPPAAREPLRGAHVPAEPMVDRGTLRVCVFEKDHTPAVGVWVRLLRPDASDFWHGEPRARTGIHGSCRFENQAEGRVAVVLDRNVRGSAKIEAGKETELTLEIPEGLDIDGLVVNAVGEPVSNAEIWMSGFGRTIEGEVTTQSGADGTFHIPSAATDVRIHARAPGYASSLTHWLRGAAGTTTKVKLVLESQGGEVMGRVLDPEGEPIENAIVRLGVDQPRGFNTRADGSLVAPTDTLRVKTDAEGFYRVRGFAPGPSELVVRASGYTPWRGSVSVSLQMPTRLDVQRERGKASTKLVASCGEEVEWNAVVMTSGLEIVGRVLDEREEPAAGWTVRVQPIISARAGEPPQDWYEHLMKTNTDGRFVVKNCRDLLHRVWITAPGSSMMFGKHREVKPGPNEILFRVSTRDLQTVRIVGRVCFTIRWAHSSSARTPGLRATTRRAPGSPAVSCSCRESTRSRQRATREPRARQSSRSLPRGVPKRW